jgi:hypothetical protein
MLLLATFQNHALHPPRLLLPVFVDARVQQMEPKMTQKIRAVDRHRRTISLGLCCLELRCRRG